MLSFIKDQGGRCTAISEIFAFAPSILHTRAFGMITTIEKNQILTILFSESKPSTFSSLWDIQTIQSRDEGEVGALHFLEKFSELF